MFAGPEARRAVRRGRCRRNLRAAGSDLGLTPPLCGRQGDARLVGVEKPAVKERAAGSDLGLTPPLCGRQGDTRLVGVEKPAVKEDAAHEPGRLEQTRREP